jgi:hypothetical protein
MFTDNQNGDATIFILLSSILLSSLLLFWTLKKSDIYLEEKYFQKQTLCFKNFLNITRTHIDKVKQLNFALKHIDNINLALKIFPLPIKPLAGATSMVIKRSFISLQNLSHLNWQLGLTRMKLKKCHFSYSTFKSPFYHNGITIRRFKKGLAKMRKNFRGTFSKLNFNYNWNLNPNKDGYFDVSFHKR